MPNSIKSIYYIYMNVKFNKIDQICREFIWDGIMEQYDMSDVNCKIKDLFISAIDNLRAGFIFLD